MIWSTLPQILFRVIQRFRKSCLPATANYGHNRTESNLISLSASGITIVELLVVLFIVAVLVALGARSWMQYRDQYAFSNSVRKLNHAIALARIRAIQTQSTSRLLFRPNQTLANPHWQAGNKYDLGTIVDDGLATYRCTLVHASSTINRPGAKTSGRNWKRCWEVVSDFQYDTNAIGLKHCPEGTDCIDASLYIPEDPAGSIQFNCFGVPSDNLDHEIIASALRPYGGNVKITVTTLGRIKGGS